MAKNLDKLDLTEGIIYGYGNTTDEKGSTTAYQKANYVVSPNEVSDKIKNVLPNEGLMDPAYLRDRMFTKFSKFGYNDPYNRVLNTKEVLF